MTDGELNLTIQILREIQATQAEHTRALSDIKERLVLQDLRLQTHSGMFEEIAMLLRRLSDRTRDLTKRVDAVEVQRDD
jgi:hypothetical protein